MTGERAWFVTPLQKEYRVARFLFWSLLGVMVVLIYRDLWWGHVTEALREGWPRAWEGHSPVSREKSVQPAGLIVLPDKKVPPVSDEVDADGAPTVGDIIARLQQGNMVSGEEPGRKAEGLVRVDRKPDSDGRSAGSHAVFYRLQIASFRDPTAARALMRKLRRGGFDSVLVRLGSWWVVRSHRYSDEAEARRVARWVARRFHLRVMVRRVH